MSILYIAMSAAPDETKYDLTSFINRSEILLISDFEGTAPTKHFNKFAEYCINKKVIFLGDVFDNTGQTNEQYCGKESCDDPDFIDPAYCIKPENFCALKTIKLLVDNPDNCRYVVGNRDINKIKLIPFFSLKDLNDKWWTTGETYDEIVNNFLKSTDKNWFIGEDKLKYFRPFWNKNKVEYKERWINKKQQNVKTKEWEDYKMTKLFNIEERFLWIFGKDPGVGTMSALLTLKCIPDEICSHIKEYNNFSEFFKKIRLPDKFQSFPENKKKIIVRVVLTITIFMRMLDKTLYNPNKNIDNDPIRRQKWSLETLDGYLYHYLMEAAPAYYAAKGTNLFLFAHGGITQEFVRENGMGAMNFITERGWLDDLVGGGDTKKTLTASTAIITAINNYNTKIYFKNLMEFFENGTYKDGSDNIDFDAMLNLLTLSAGSDPKTKHYPNQVKQPTDAGDFGIIGIKIYNIFGHAAASSGYSFGKARNKDNQVIPANTYFINTDYSSTLFKGGIACDEKYNDNYLIMILDTEITYKDFLLYSDGDIFLNDKYILYNIEGDKKQVYKKLNNDDEPNLLAVFDIIADHKIKEKEKKKKVDLNIAIIPIQKEDNSEYYVKFINETFENIKKKGIHFTDKVDLTDIIDEIDKKNVSTYFLFNGIATIAHTNSQNNDQNCSYFEVFSATGKDTIQDIVLIQTINKRVCNEKEVFYHRATEDPEQVLAVTEPVLPSKFKNTRMKRLQLLNQDGPFPAQVEEPTEIEEDPLYGLSVKGFELPLTVEPGTFPKETFDAGRRTRKKRKTRKHRTRKHKRSISTPTRKRRISVSTRKHKHRTRKHRMHKQIISVS